MKKLLSIIISIMLSISGTSYIAYAAPSKIVKPVPKSIKYNPSTYDIMKLVNGNTNALKFLSTIPKDTRYKLFKTYADKENGLLECIYRDKNNVNNNIGYCLNLNDKSKCLLYMQTYSVVTKDKLFNELEKVYTETKAKLNSFIDEDQEDVGDQHISIYPEIFDEDTNSDTPTNDITTTDSDIDDTNTGDINDPDYSAEEPIERPFYVKFVGTEDYNVNVYIMIQKIDKVNDSDQQKYLIAINYINRNLDDL